MNKEKDFFKTCFDTVAGLEVKNKSQAIAKEVVLSEIKNLEQQAQKQKEVIDKAVKYIDDLRDESAERQGFYNCFPDDLYIPDINELLQILEDKEVSK